MELLDLVIEVERYVSRNGISLDDPVSELIDKMASDANEDL
ncbi:hypothetical protein MHI57_24745 [Cytobacillus sp. FSL K6-0129]